MIPWIQVYSNLPLHPKTAQLTEELGLSSQQVGADVMTMGILVALWTWAIQNAYDGDLSKCSPRLIAEVCRWKRSPEKLVECLQKADWLDDNLHLHNWDDYAVRYIEAAKKQKEMARERKQRSRTQKSCDDCVTVT